jgi:hypothetical protein
MLKVYAPQPHWIHMLATVAIHLLLSLSIPAISSPNLVLPVLWEHGV